LVNREHTVFTSVNFNYLGRALTLARSVKEHNPDIYFVLLVVEPDFTFSKETKEILLRCDDGNTFNEILTLNDLNLPISDVFWKYTVVEMCTAVKGQASVHLLNRDDAKFVTYLDPDLFFYRTLEDIRTEHINGDVLLTPHLNHVPYLNSVILNDEIAGVMRHGIFNLGFVSFKNSKNGRDIAAWWADRLQISSKSDYANGLFTDQKWWDLSQVYFKNTWVVKNDGWNMAPWNISERRLVAETPPTLDSGESLFFFHFSKFPSSAFDEKIRHQAKSEILASLINNYGIRFSSSQEYVKKILTDLHDYETYAETSLRLIPRRKPKSEILLTKVLNSLVQNQFLRKAIGKRNFLETVAKKMYSQFYKLIYRIEVTSSRNDDLGKIEDIKLDLLIFTHMGGGGVAEVIRQQVRINLDVGKSVGVINPNLTGELVLTLSNVGITINVGDRLSKIIAQSIEIDVHHILGLEGYLDQILKRKIDRLYLHDKYLMTQMPFSDASQFVSIAHDAPGINMPLSISSKYSEVAWPIMTRKILEGSKRIFAPSDYLSNAYKVIFPELNIEKYQLEKNFEVLTSSEKFAGKDSVLVVSPTGLHKGSSVVIGVAKILLDLKPSIAFKIFGDLEIHSEQELKKLENVILNGQVTRSRLHQAIINSPRSIGWIPSLTGESYSLALSDMLSNGLTVLATNLGALPERLRRVPGNYLYDPAIPTALLGSLIVAIAENDNLEEFKPYIECT
jgi:glycosyltransferase involved in cell wall biosynthesis